VSPSFDDRARAVLALLSDRFSFKDLAKRIGGGLSTLVRNVSSQAMPLLKTALKATPLGGMLGGLVDMLPIDDGPVLPTITSNPQAQLGIPVDARTTLTSGIIREKMTSGFNADAYRSTFVPNRVCERVATDV